MRQSQIIDSICTHTSTQISPLSLYISVCVCVSPVGALIAYGAHIIQLSFGKLQREGGPRSLRSAPKLRLWQTIRQLICSGSGSVSVSMRVCVCVCVSDRISTHWETQRESPCQAGCPSERRSPVASLWRAWNLGQLLNHCEILLTNTHTGTHWAGAEPHPALHAACPLSKPSCVAAQLNWTELSRAKGRRKRKR